MLGLNLHWLYAHFIGDYLLSNDKISVKKKESSLWCMLHVGLYMIPFLFTQLNLLQLVLIAVQHFIQDRWNFIGWFNKLFGRFQHESVRVWGHIIVDNLIHILWMAFVVHNI